jgi:hypothetical protein
MSMFLRKDRHNNNLKYKHKNKITILYTNGPLEAIDSGKIQRTVLKIWLLDYQFFLKIMLHNNLSFGFWIILIKG